MLNIKMLNVIQMVQSFVDNLCLILRNRQRLYITFDYWPIERTPHNLSKDAHKYIWFNYFYNIISNTNHRNTSRNEMLEDIKKFHKKQIDLVKKFCEEFEQRYESKDILQWYTKASFIYLLLNRTVRSIDINQIFSMRYIIFDLEKHSYQYPSMTMVYRGQQIHLDEINDIQSNIGGLFGLTSFWSTSYSKETALRFTKIWPKERQDSVESVLFTIKIPCHLKQAIYLGDSP